MRLVAKTDYRRDQKYVAEAIQDPLPKGWFPNILQTYGSTLDR